MDAGSKPNLEELRKLYAAAIEFKELAPWNWMRDNNLFGVMNPENGEVGYCCVMGAIGEHFALGVYLGSEGLASLVKISSGVNYGDAEDALCIQKCLMASFEDRKYVQENDVNQIKDLGLNFRGKNEWPLFRNHSPGFVPWYLSGSEVVFAYHASGEV